MVAKPSELGGKYFETQAERDEYIRLVLRKGTRVLEGQERSVAFDLLLLHPDAAYKIGVGLRQIQVKRSRQGIYYCFWVVRVDGSEDDFSYEKCKYNLDRLIKKRRESAYREAVQEQIEYFHYVHRASSQSCDLCGSQQDLQVDHYQPTFIDLVNDFETGKSDLPTEFEEVQKTVYSKRFCKSNSQYKEAWQHYHQQDAHLRLLCKKDNLARNRRCYRWRTLQPPTI